MTFCVTWSLCHTTGKSNIMDAISFVLGVKGSYLRSSHLSDLIYRPTTAERGGAKPKKASVCAVYEKADGTVVRFSRTCVPLAERGRCLLLRASKALSPCTGGLHCSVSSNNHSEYKIDDKTVSFADYSKTLAEEKVLVKARNFLVFQVCYKEQPKVLAFLFVQTITHKLAMAHAPMTGRRGRRGVAVTDRPNAHD